MRRKLDCVQSLLGLIMGVCGVVYADSYRWSGGDGRWADSSKWTPNGMPGSAANDVATFPVWATQTVTVDTDVSLRQIDLAAKVANVRQTYSIAAGKTLALDLFNLYKDTAADDIMICGGGTFALTNSPFYASGTINPVSVTISGEGTVFHMPKEASSGLYIGSVDNNYLNSPDVFRVTAGAKAIVSNATCVGNSTNGGTTGKLIVDDGGYFYGGMYLFIGRGARVPGGIVCAVTNATVEAEVLGLGNGWYNTFVGSNAVVRSTDDATGSISFPINGNHTRYAYMDFEDSLLEAPTIGLLSSGIGTCASSTGTLARCVLKCDTLDGCFGNYCTDSIFTLVDSCVTSATISVSGKGASNNVLRVVNSEIVCNNGTINIGCADSVTNTFRVEGGRVICRVLKAGCEQTANESRYEQVGGDFTATGAILAGAADSRHCGASFDGVSLTAPEIICGDVMKETLRSQDAYLEFANMTGMSVQKLYVGIGSVGANMIISNTTAAVTYSAVDDASSTIIGRDAGATGNCLTLVDSTLVQTGGNLYMGRWSYASNNTIRLVNSTYDFRTINSKGDVIVGYSGDSNGNRVEMDDHSTFGYDRKWMAVGQFAASNVWSMAGGSTLNAANTTFALGVNASAVGNRLVLGGGCSFAVGTLAMKYDAVLEVSGVGNTMTLGNDITVTDGCSYVFRPCAEASATPMLTINRAFQYSSDRKIYVDLANAGVGRHVLCASSSALTDPVAGSNVVLQNVPKNCSVRVFRSADTMSLVCAVAPAGTTIILR